VNAPQARAQLARIERGLRMVTVPFPHLAGLCAATRVALDDRVPTMGVFASGRLVANPAFAARLKDSELVFVLAHEMLHLALRTHDRAKGSSRLEFNYAHDYIINDMLRAELGVTSIPAGGLDMPGARERSAEAIVLEMRKNGEAQTKSRVWEGEASSPRRVFGGGGGKPAGPQEGNGGDAGDVLGEDLEREMFPGDAESQRAAAEKMKEIAARALGLAKAMGAMKGPPGADPGAASQMMGALRGLYRTPWQLGLQRWLESVAPGDRTFNRPSRRGADRSDIVLPGRKREGWILNVVLDTSGSMTDELPRALGAIADFCDAVAVDAVRIVQCDTVVTSDELVEPAELSRREVSGFGGSDLSPALVYLAADPTVRATVVVTDGEVAYPAERMPYDVLWIVTPPGSASFAPPYGQVVAMEPAR
jgi:predicted metal-dependent peptidase